MRRLVVTSAVFTVALLVAGCSGEAAVTMPDVVGKGLDVAISDVKRAGIDDEVEVLGGGMFGVVDKSNWKVCSQEPQIGAKVSTAPRLTVDRTCDNAKTASEEPTQGPSEKPEQSAPTEAAAVVPELAQTLTVESNEDLAALLAGSASDGDMVEAFAAKYEGKNIEFDGNIAHMDNHGSYKTRYDILIAAGDYSKSTTTGPNFQFKDVNIVSDLRLTGSNVPDTIGAGQNLHIIARVEGYNRIQELFFLKPVSTEVR
ncbi:DUF4839 domain-containing protein [Arthrobacter sp. YAF17]|uniref:DUF4839 domain-containing protein n=1 Tax=Arthrobacter sp. YAF17 TaxID=3233077 RepID=UPI003F8EA986